MKNKKILYKLLVFIIIFSTLLSFSTSFAEEKTATREEIIKSLKSNQSNNPFELALSEILLKIGDTINEYIIYLYRDNITIDRIVFNRVKSLNANFFDYEHTDGITTYSDVISDIINNWYSFFKGLAIVCYLIILVAIGIKILLGPGVAKATARDLLLKWTFGIALLLLFPYVMHYAFKINDGILKTVSETFTRNNSYDEYIGSYIGRISDVSFDDALEFRSPEYISRSDYVYSLGSSDATLEYYKQLEASKTRGDVMRILRAMAGVTGRLIYIILWLIMLGQMLILLFVYTKRYLMIAFLIIVFPITVVQYIIGLVTTGKGGAGFSAWCQEFFINVFIQTIHAIIYGIIGGVVMANVQSTLAIEGLTRVNAIVLIIAINFLFQGEAILKKIIKANAESVRTGGETFKSARGIRKNVRRALTFK